VTVRVTESQPQTNVCSKVGWRTISLRMYAATSGATVGRMADTRGEEGESIVLGVSDGRLDSRPFAEFFKDGAAGRVVIGHVSTGQ
jgi:hypothetical protein